MIELEVLGFKCPKILVNNQGIEVYIPDNENSDNWFVHIPRKLLKVPYTKEYNCVRNGFDYYGITKEEVLRVVRKYTR